MTIDANNHVLKILRVRFENGEVQQSWEVCICSLYTFFNRNYSYKCRDFDGGKHYLGHLNTVVAFAYDFSYADDRCFVCEQYFLFKTI